MEGTKRHDEHHEPTHMRNTTPLKQHSTYKRNTQDSTAQHILTLNSHSFNTRCVPCRRCSRMYAPCVDVIRRMIGRWIIGRSPGPVCERSRWYVSCSYSVSKMWRCCSHTTSTCACGWYDLIWHPIPSNHILTKSSSATIAIFIDDNHVATMVISASFENQLKNKKWEIIQGTFRPVINMNNCWKRENWKLKAVRISTTHHIIA